MGLTGLAERVQGLWTETPMVEVSGRVVAAAPSGFSIAGLSRFLKLGSLVTMHTPERRVLGEVVRLNTDAVIVKPFEDASLVGLGTRVSPGSKLTLHPRREWQGRIVNALGKPIDAAGPLPWGEPLAIDNEPPAPMSRSRVTEAVRTGIRAIDAFAPLCAGQRIGVFAGSGIGKTTLLSMLARAGGFDSVVVALVGERGREVREFVEESLKAALHRTVTVVSTGDESPMMRKLAPRAAMRIAEYFRDAGDKVLLIMDSVTRYAHACRDIALSAGEPPVTRGYPPSVFSDLPRLLERAGPGGGGSITGIFSVLVDGDDHNDPVADAIRGTLDGHIVLDRAIAEQGRYPAVNVLASVSRLAPQVWTPDQQALVAKLRGMIARFEETRDLRALGGYQVGLDPELDRAMAVVPKLYDALLQSPAGPQSRDAFQEIAAKLAAEG